MSTVINNPGPTPTTVERTTVEHTDGGAGWAVAIILLLVVLAVGAFAWVQYGQPRQAPAAAPSSTGGTNINVTVPPAENSGDTSGGTAPSGSAGAGATGGVQQPTPAQ